jgi:hypothetical protein
MAALVVLPFIVAGVVQVDPSVLVADMGRPAKPLPTATNRPAELTVTDVMKAAVVVPFMAAGVVNPLNVGTAGSAPNTANPGPMTNPGPIVSGIV